MVFGGQPHDSLNSVDMLDPEEHLDLSTCINQRLSPLTSHRKPGPVFSLYSRQSNGQRQTLGVTKLSLVEGLEKGKQRICYRIQNGES